MLKCEEHQKSKEFEQELKNQNTDINTFIKLLNKWSDMSTAERIECTTKLAR